MDATTAWTRTTVWWVGLLAALLVLTLTTPVGAQAQEDDPPPLEDLCASADLGDLPHGADITSREIRPASADLPQVCEVKGTIVTSPASTIMWEVELPDPAAWNDRTVTIGGGGFDGFIPTDSGFYQAMVGPTGDPYVKMSSDSGHQVPGFYPWALDDDALDNHGYEANHLTLEVGTHIATEFYGHAPARRYMIGQSNGGRSGLVAAQRYPDDYDGIIALEPAISQQAHEAFLPETFKHIFSDRDNWMSPEDIELFAAAEVEACDGLDGLEDGIISHIDACDYMGADLACDDGQTEGCLTSGQLESIRLIYTNREGFSLPDGLTPGYPRFGRGGPATGDWTNYMFGSTFEARDSFNYFAETEAAKVVTDDPDANALTIQPDEHEADYRRLSEQLDPTSHDLTAFKESGGKLFIWYGLGDTCVSVYRTAQYLQALKDEMGEDVVDGFVRLLTSPGLGHNLAGPGAGSIDFLSTMDDWLDNDDAPDELVGSKYPGGFFDYDSQPEFQRPVCQWPTYPHYVGGDPDDAGSFVCITADQAGNQNLTVTVPDEPPTGEFVWSIQGDGHVDLGDMADQGTYLGATGPIDPIAVTDTRTGGPQWSIAGQVSDFEPGELDGSHLGWTPQVLAPGAGAQAGPTVPSGLAGGGDGLSVAQTMASAEAGHPEGTARIGADLDLRFPVETDPGEYTATLTITALS